MVVLIAELHCSRKATSQDHGMVQGKVQTTNNMI